MYQDLHAPLAPILRHALAHAPLPPAGTALDLACGAGEKWPLLRAALGPGVRLVGLDIDRAALRGWAAGAGSRLAADAHALPLRPASLDAAFCVAALGLLADPPLALRELRRALRPGAPALLVTGAQLWAEVTRWPDDLADALLAAVPARALAELAPPELGHGLAETLLAAGFGRAQVQPFLLARADDGARLALPLVPWRALRPLAAARLAAADLARCEATRREIELVELALVGVTG